MAEAIWKALWRLLHNASPHRHSVVQSTEGTLWASRPHQPRRLDCFKLYYSRVMLVWAILVQSLLCQMGGKSSSLGEEPQRPQAHVCFPKQVKWPKQALEKNRPQQVSSTHARNQYSASGIFFSQSGQSDRSGAPPADPDYAQLSRVPWPVNAELAQPLWRRGESNHQQAPLHSSARPANVNSCGQDRTPATAHLAWRLSGQLTAKPFQWERPCCVWGFHQSAHVPFKSKAGVDFKKMDMPHWHSMRGVCQDLETGALRKPSKYRRSFFNEAIKHSWKS